MEKLKDITDIEIKLLLDAINARYGYDFSDYSPAHIKRRVLNRCRLSRLKSVSEMQEKVLHDKTFAIQLLQDLSITVTEMFRNPDFYQAIRLEVIPYLKTYPFFRIWHAGCSTGEEVYSMAIMLQEEGILDRATIYATDFNQSAINYAKDGIYPRKLIKEYAYNYYKSGGREDFSKYYSEDQEHVIMANQLKKNIVWANHNLVTDGVFSTVHLILCRNVMIYFNKKLQNRVHELFYDSLIKGGFLCLGAKESIKFTNLADRYIEVDKKQKLLKKSY
jgi:chemotaxis protein methyltransferase CheR